MQEAVDGVKGNPLPQLLQASPWRADLHPQSQLGPRPRIPVPPVLQSFRTFLVVAPHRLLDPAGSVQGDPSDLLSGEPLLGVVDRQETGPLDWVLGLLHPLP